jgi:hypothetical protein
MSVQFSSNLEAIKNRLETEAKKRVFEAANEIRNETLSTLSGNRSGRVYRVPGTQRTYVASAPGEAPAVQFGDLRRSIAVAQPVVENQIVLCKVGSDLEKAPMLELGTRKIKPRPFFVVSAKRAETRVKAIMNERWF